ncbi:MAG: exosortase/archaeosortase family protein [Deltaproteobacteria bacterium]|nr:exosortase/archaeosortase family protein [Deltaproteobacteria bacterium]
MATEVDAHALGRLSDRRFAVASAAGTSALATVIFAPILYYMVIHWGDQPDYSHGFLIAPLAAYFAWERRGKLRRVEVAPSWWGLVPLALGALSLMVGRLGVELMSMRAAFVFTLIGLNLLLLGIPMFRILAFPMLFLFLMVPLPQSLVNVIAFPLQLLAADLAVQTLQVLGYPVLREGNIIHLPNSQLFVAEACSGLRSLMALGTLGIVFAYFFRKHWVERVILVASTLPIAVLVNAFRVWLTSVLTLRFGEEAASGAVHQTEGFFTFGLAFALLLLEARMLTFLRSRAGATAPATGVRT